MSNKRQLKMSATSNRLSTTSSTRTTFILSCDLKRVLGLNFVCILLLLVTSTTLIVESAKLEAKNNNKNITPFTETVTKSTKIKFATNDDDDDNYSNSAAAAAADKALLLRQQHKHDTLDEAAENFYHSELQRLSYDTIHSILRDENEPIFRGEDNDRRYYHAKSLQPTHEIMKREANEFEAKSVTPKTDNYDINLSSKSLKTFNITEYEHLLTLNLSHNQLSALPLSPNSTVVLLDLNSNRIQAAAAPLNTHLRALYLSGNRIENLAALNLSQLTTLETLDLSCNRIQNLETSFFPQLMHNLKYLNLAQNRLGSISRETFYNLLSLNTLLLAHNNITNIDYETFLSLPNLQYLDLSHNQLRGESIRALQGIPDLVGLSIAYNPDMGESLQEFVASWSLKEVDASGTGLCQIPAALAQAVRTLKLADNWLKIINCGDLDSYPLLTHLDLSNSHIEQIEDDAMGRLEFLELLFLDHNRLRKVPVSLPTSLEHLFLQNNEIMDLQVQAFAGLKNLKTLDLSHNKLLYLPALPLPKLLTLNLQASGLQGLNQAIVHTLPHLRDLLLEENPIKCSDLLGIAEWASPCRIAERIAASGSGATATATKTTDGEQIANGDGDVDVDGGVGVGGVVGDVGGDVGQKLQQQTVAKIDLKAKFVQTHNFYEKFAGSGVCVGVVGRQMAAKTIGPPTCAVELEDEVVLKAEKPTVLTTAKKLAAAAVGGALAAVEQPNVNLNEQHKLAQVEKSTTAETTKAPTGGTDDATVTPSQGSTKNANHVTETPAPKTFVTKNFVIAHVTTGPVEVLKSTAAVMPTTFSTKLVQTTAEPTISLTSTTLAAATTKTMAAIKTLNKSFETAATKSPNLSLLLPETMTTKMPAKMPTSSSPTTTRTGKMAAPTTIKPIATVSKLRSSLLERQRRLEATTLESLLTSTTTTKTATTSFTDTPTSPHQAKNLARNIGSNDSQKMLHQRKSSKNFEHSNGETKNKSFSELSKALPTAMSSKVFEKTLEPQQTTTTTIGPQHKHVTLQLNSKDRHLIGTPLLTHHGQNLMVAAEELKKNGNHITDKTTVAAATTTTPHAVTKQQKKQQPLDKGQNQQTEKEVNKFSKVHDAENVATTTAATSIETTTTTVKPTMMSNVKLSSKKQLNEHKKKTTTLIMKKMTITTTATKQQQQHNNAAMHTPKPQGGVEIKATHHQQAENQHHHYTLNTPHDNEATLTSSGSNNLVKSTAEQSLEQPHRSQGGFNVKHHSTVNTPVINGHETEPQTFQEHNEIEEAAAAVAARASISAKFNSKLHDAHHSPEWSDRQQARLYFDNPTVVFIVGIALFVTLVVSLLHAYRCKMPAILNLQRQHQQQRPHRQHQSHQQQQQQLLQQGQQMRIRHKHADDDETPESHSFLNGGSNQFQRQWRLERASNQPQTQQAPHPAQPQQSSPFHNLQVRGLQQTSAIEPCPRYCKRNYNISSALVGERSNSHTSSSCSPHSSCTFDDETCYIEMTTDVGQPIAGAGSSTTAISQCDLLPMELLSVARRDFHENQQQQQQQHSQHLPISTSHHTPAFQTSTLDESSSSIEDVLANQNVSNTKLTPRTRKLGLW